MRYQRAELPLKLDGLMAARRFFAGCLAEGDPRRERLWVAHVDEEARCLHLTSHSSDAGDTDFPLSEIMVDAAHHGSAGIVLAHNRPGGDARPSDSDCGNARRLAAAADAFGCTVLDHLVFAGTDWTSLRQLGYL